MKLSEMVARLRLKVTDTDKEKFPEDEELEQEILDAMYRHNKDYTKETVPENEEYLIIKLAQISLYYILASREAKNYRVTVDNITVSKADRVKNYLDLAKMLEEEYQAVVGSPDYAEIKVENMKRYSVGVNRLVGGNDE